MGQLRREKVSLITEANGTISQSPVSALVVWAAKRSLPLVSLQSKSAFRLRRYPGVSQGLTLIEGKMHAKLTNGNGVVMYLAGETEGLASSIGVQAFEVTLTD